MSVRRGEGYRDEALKLSTITLALVAIALVLLATVRLQRGMIGFILAGLAIALVIYWLKELYTAAKKEMTPSVAKHKKWFYDIIDEKESITIVAEVPGPEEMVKAEVVGRTVKIYGGQEFAKEVKLPKDCELVESSYTNGVLSVKLRKKPNTKASEPKSS
jgi:HSP20 family molecular chaperone IbpA